MTHRDLLDQEHPMHPQHPTEVSGTPLVTAGRQQMLVHCPRCDAVHRHLDTGARRGPCGARYLVTGREDPAGVAP
ncbi:hypothetical protein [Streptomyces mirabilis]|uniref:hypothetical protein n=1 Tax=Streptomyces mirabilis TaxID=68239 RepID=UPI0036C344EB